MSQGKSSDALVGVLLEELGKASAGDSGVPEYFEGQVQEPRHCCYLNLVEYILHTALYLCSVEFYF